MLYLHQYPGVWNLPSLSPFCVKVETYLKMANLPYEVVIENNPRKGPKGKMPVLRDKDRVIPDSSFIIQYLKAHYSINLDDGLSSQQLASAHTIKKMIEENLYFAILYSRWIDPQGKQVVDQEYRQFFPKPLAGLALKIIRRNLQKQAHQQGIGRHTLEEVYQLGCQDINAISELMGTNLFMLGDQPHTIDATVYAFLITILHTGFANPLTTYTKAQLNLVAYCDRMKREFFMT